MPSQVGETCRIEDETDASIPEDSGAGNPRNMTNAPAEGFHHHLLLPQEIVHQQGTVAIAIIDDHEESLRGIGDGLGNGE